MLLPGSSATKSTAPAQQAQYCFLLPRHLMVVECFRPCEARFGWRDTLCAIQTERPVCLWIWIVWVSRSRSPAPKDERPGEKWKQISAEPSGIARLHTGLQPRKPKSGALREIWLSHASHLLRVQERPMQCPKWLQREQPKQLPRSKQLPRRQRQREQIEGLIKLPKQIHQNPKKYLY